MKVRTYYDNLKVSRDAPAEVIRAAYKSLSQKYHPDKCHGDIQSEKIMRLINEAYEVLSDPKKREQHDKWIRFEEWKAAHKVDSDSLREQSKASSTKRAHASAGTKIVPRWRRELLSLVSLLINIFTLVVRGFLFFALLGVFGFVIYEVVDGYSSRTEITVTPEESQKELRYVEKYTEQTAAGASVGHATQTQAAPVMCSLAMTKAPNGNAWPSSSAYVAPITKTNGYSSITIDNSQGQSNIYIKLAHPNEGKLPGIREAYIPANKKFKMNKIEPGIYMVKYKDVETGCNYKSDFFRVEESKSQQGVEFSDVTLTIYTMYNGNMSFEGLSENEF